MRPEHKLKVLHGMIAMLHKMPAEGSPEEEYHESPGEEAMEQHEGLEEDKHEQYGGLHSALSNAKPQTSSVEEMHAEGGMAPGPEASSKLIHGPIKSPVGQMGRSSQLLDNEYEGPKGGQSNLQTALALKKKVQKVTY